MSIHRIIDLTMCKMERHYPIRIQFLKSMCVIVTDEIGQSSAQFDSVCDNIILLLCGVNLFKVNKLRVGECDPTQL